MTDVEGMTDTQRQALFASHKRHYVTALAAKKASDAAFRNACKAARAELGDKAVDEIKATIQLETPAGEAIIREQMALLMRAAVYMGASLGTQFEMFGDEKKAESRAYLEGRRDAMEGEPFKPVYAHGTADHDDYAKGHQEGSTAAKDLDETRKAEAAPLFDQDKKPKARKGRKTAEEALQPADAATKAMAKDDKAEKPGPVRQRKEKVVKDYDADFKKRNGLTKDAHDAEQAAGEQILKGALGGIGDQPATFHRTN